MTPSFTPHGGHRPPRIGKEPSVSDHSLERAVMEALADNPHIHPEEIAVEAQGDRVILRGTVGTLFQEAEAVRTTQHVRGVFVVDNRLAARPTALEARDDVDTEAAVLAALIDDDELPAAAIDVDAEDGAVTLSGLVALESQREDAERVARSVGGVTHVRNDIRLAPVVSADEAAERITNALGVDALLGSDRVSVVVIDNDVTLSGSVVSDAHRETAVATAGRLPGVTAVHDHLEVRPRG
jgi:osmotically-inducible protein OsmY